MLCYKLISSNKLKLKEDKTKTTKIIQTNVNFN